jgi:hypothetical protein
MYTLTGIEQDMKMNFDEFWSLVNVSTKKQVREPESEYHYVAVDKNCGKFLLKSIIDIHSYKTNPTNILHINWNHEFAHINYKCKDYAQKSKELLKTVRTSIKQDIVGKVPCAMTNLT